MKGTASGGFRSSRVWQFGPVAERRGMSRPGRRGDQAPGCLSPRGGMRAGGSGMSPILSNTGAPGVSGAVTARRVGWVVILTGTHKRWMSALGVETMSERRRRSSREIDRAWLGHRALRSAGRSLQAGCGQIAGARRRDAVWSRPCYVPGRRGRVCSEAFRRPRARGPARNQNGLQLEKSYGDPPDGRIGLLLVNHSSHP